MAIMQFPFGSIGKQLSLLYSTKQLPWDETEGEREGQ